MKKILIVVAAAMLMPVLTGCLSMMARQELIRAQQRRAALEKQSAQSRRIESINFIVEPPAENNFPTLIPDEKLKHDIVGTWECSISTNSFSETKINGTISTSFNLPEGQSHTKFSFFPDGNVEGLATTEQPSASGGAPQKHAVKQKGKWYVKNGELYISFFSEEHNETYGIRTISVWRSADSFELQYDPDDYMRLVRSLMKKAKYPANLKVTNDVEYYHAQSGNTYHITKLHIVHSNGQVSDSKVIVKMSKMVFQKTKVK